MPQKRTTAMAGAQPLVSFASPAVSYKNTAGARELSPLLVTSVVKPENPNWVGCVHKPERQGEELITLLEPHAHPEPGGILDSHPHQGGFGQNLPHSTARLCCSRPQGAPGPSWSQFRGRYVPGTHNCRVMGSPGALTCNLFCLPCGIWGGGRDRRSSHVHGCISC